MSYLVLARKYRPQNFSAVIGQESVTKILLNSIRRRKVAHAILLAGPRGVGKTSIARIFAKALNCAQPNNAEPCLKCQNCVEISENRSLAVLEIDGASHNSVDDIRQLTESFKTLPAPGYKEKVYIIDEVHMLSVQAFNALLKSLEEPPPNTILILATTDPQKIPETVLSRCQRHDLRALTTIEIISQLKQIVFSEGVKCEDEALAMIARVADGSLRDAESLLDRVIGYADGELKAELVAEALGIVGAEAVRAISRAVIAGDDISLLQTLDSLWSAGTDEIYFLKELARFWHELVLAKSLPADSRILGEIGSENVDSLRDLAKDLSLPETNRLFAALLDGGDMAIRSSNIRYAIEAFLLRITLARRSDLLLVDKDLSDKQVNNPQPLNFERLSEKKTAQIERAANANLKPVDLTPAKNSPLFNWAYFVAGIFASADKSLLPFMKECLKHVLVEDQAERGLKIKGPKQVIEYLKRGDIKEQLLALLVASDPSRRWSLSFEVGSVAGTINDLEAKQVELAMQSKKKELESDPAIKSLKEIFPGSEIVFE
ncbi:MAG TPA: DNA polymerase III subunit gamma/tau [Oligoflexia bacterium]|nr:DNA polymerase III subunit gamma/tau [Oligoflexia bacterium]HMP27397.1 DNA polymerase III subunit gamma/tau [Oligoflexia bacterium]